MQVQAGVYDFSITSSTNALTLNAPRNYLLKADDFSLTQSIIGVDITLPAKKVNVHVQDNTGASLSGISVNASGSSGSYTLAGINFDTGRSDYSLGTQPVTNFEGNTTLWLFPSANNPYTLTATPPNGSSFPTTTLPNILITNNTLQTITLQQPVILNGQVFDSLGEPLSNQQVFLDAPDGTRTDIFTNSSGSYSLQIQPGTYNLNVASNTNGASKNAPGSYRLVAENYNLQQSDTFNFTLPAKKIDVHVIDSLGNDIENVSVNGSSGGGGSYNISGTDFTGRSDYNLGTQPTTNSEGDATLWLFSGPIPYTFTATPPAGSDFVLTTVSNVIVNSDSELTIVLEKPVTISGHIYDPFDNELPNQLVYLEDSNGNRTDVFTNGEGEYSLKVRPGLYDFNITSSTNGTSYNAPGFYRLEAVDYSLNQDRVVNITLPVKKVDVHIQDNLGSPVDNITVNASGSNDTYTISGINFSGTSNYNLGTKPITDINGNTSLWLLPSTSNPYTFVATPPTGSVYAEFILNNVFVTTNQTEVISLQYSHSTPTTTISLSPTPRSDGTYPSPVTVTISAIAASGYTVANTFYKINNGSTQTYSAPVTLSNLGDYEIEYWSIDNSGVQESHKTKTFTISEQSDPVTLTFYSNADAFIRNTNPQHNFGGGTNLKVQNNGDTRSLLRFDQTELQNVIGSQEVLSAKIRLTIVDNGANWGDGRWIDLHSLEKSWAEGNGTENGRGSGEGSTWECAIDTNILNTSPNCSGITAWNMDNNGPFAITATDSVSIKNSSNGVIEFDVTSDIHAFMNGTVVNNGWLIKKRNENNEGRIFFGSRESAAPPQLVITYLP